MDNEFDLTFSEEGLLSRVLYLSSNTTLTIFVEDINKEFEYEEIFEKIFPENIHIDCIFPTGGKPRLEEAFELFGNNQEYGKTFFIADGDFDVALEKDMIVSKNFVYLKRYNIESYLPNETAILKFMRPRLQKSYQETKNIVDYNGWINILSPFFNKLFALHCAVQKYAPEIENVGRNPAQFLNGSGFPNTSRFNSYKDEIEYTVPNIDEKIDTMLNKLMTIYGADTGSFVCGKYYICAIKLYLNTMLKKKINEDEVKAFSISWLNANNLQYIKEQLLCYLSNT